MITEENLDTICHLLMANDPDTLGDVKRSMFTNWLDYQCSLKGYEDWIHFYHRNQDGKTTGNSISEDMGTLAE